MVHHVQGSMAGGAVGARAERAAGEAGGGGWPAASRIDAQRDAASGQPARPRAAVAFLKKLHLTSLHFTSLHFTSLHFTSLHFILKRPCVW